MMNLSSNSVTVEPRDRKRIYEDEDDSSQEGRHSNNMEREDMFCPDDDEWNSREEDEVKPRIALKKKQKKYLQKYSAIFENSPVFRGWVKPSSKGHYYAYCIPCGTHIKITSGKTDLKRHSQMKKHKMNLAALHHDDNRITAHILGQEQPIANVELPVSGKDSKTPQKRKYYQRYSHSFERDPEFAGWVTASPRGDSFAHCIPCDVELCIRGGKTDLKRHAKNKKHTAAKEEFDQRPLPGKSSPLDQCTTTFLPTQNCSIDAVELPMMKISASMKGFEDNQKSPITLEVSPLSKIIARSGDKDSNALASRISEAELQIAAFIAQHDLPLDIPDHLVQLIKAICPYSSVAQNLCSGGTDILLLINSVLGKEGSDGLMQLLRENHFSLIVDEVTDRSLERYLSLVVRVLHNYSVMEAFLSLIPLKDATAESIYDMIVDFFTKNGIPYQKNMLGIAMDGGNTLLGEHPSLSSLMKQQVPQLFEMKCISHSFSLCASAACLKLPCSLEDLARDVYSYFQYSHNHTKLQEFKAFIQVKPHKLLHPAQTRWLSMHTVVSKILEKYDSLKAYFTEAVLLDKLEASEIILQRLKLPVTKLYLMFLDFILPLFDNLDKQMQSESTQIHVIHNAVAVTLKAIFECYLDDEYMKTMPLKDINYTDQTKFKPLEEMYLGIKVQLEVTNFVHLEHDDLKEFQMNCLEFLIESVSQIYKRFPFGSPVFESLENFNPKIVIEKNIPSLINLICHFEHLATPDIQVVDSEWRLLRNMLVTLPVDSSMRPEVFWDTVSKARQIDNVLMCPNLSEFMLKLLCLPSCTATTENILSTVSKMIKKSKNISRETLLNLMYTKQVVWSKA